MRFETLIPILFFPISYAINEEESGKQLELGNSFLSKGQLSEALSHYHNAIENNPSNFQAINRRATTYQAMGRMSTALVDLTKVLELKPDFNAARVQRANILLRQGKLDEALKDFEILPKTSEIETKISTINEQSQYTTLIKEAIDNDDCDNAIEYINFVIEAQNLNPFLYRSRSKCSEKQRKLKEALNDIINAIKMTSDGTDDMFDASQLFFKVGKMQESLGIIRECLKLNPDHKNCYKFYKKIRKIVKSLDSMKISIDNKDWPKCVSEGEKLQKLWDEREIIQNVNRMTCQCYRENGQSDKAIKSCEEVLMDDENDIDVLCQRAEAYIDNDDYESALRDYEKVLEIVPENSEATKGINRINQLKKNAGKRDYYKILGVKRSASKREITKAYRKMAQKWHPDNFQNEDEKKNAEKRFIDIAAAKEVLTDDEKRSKFDNGFDPLDSESQKHDHHGFNPFAHGFNPFQNGGDEQFFFYRN